MKPVIYWDAVAAPQRDKSGNVIPEKYTGAFRTRVPAGTPGAYHYSGETPAAKWDYHAIEATVVRGYLRWIDKVLPTFENATAKLVLWMESDKTLHKISVDYNAQSMRDVMNRVKRLGKGVSAEFLNLEYWVREAVDNKKQVKTNDKGKAILAKTLQFKDVNPYFDYDAWQLEVSDKGLQWEQRTLPDGKKYWDNSKELAYWDNILISVQRYLLTTPDVLPFTYGSLTVCKNSNPSGGGNLNDSEIEKCREIYEAKKAGYRMPFSKEAVDADDVLANVGAAPVATTAQVAIADPFQASDADPFPTSEHKIAGFDDSDLPF